MCDTSWCKYRVHSSRPYYNILLYFGYTVRDLKCTKHSFKRLMPNMQISLKQRVLLTLLTLYQSDFLLEDHCHVGFSWRIACDQVGVQAKQLMVLYIEICIYLYSVLYVLYCGSIKSGLPQWMGIHLSVRLNGNQRPRTHQQTHSHCCTSSKICSKPGQLSTHHFIGSENQNVLPHRIWSCYSVGEAVDCLVFF